MVKKLIRAGKVGVLISHGHGTGWSTWNTSIEEEVLFSPEIIELVEKEATTEEINKKAEELWGDDVDFVDSNNLFVRWIPIGTRFTVEEHDGYECLITEHNLPFTA